MDKPRRADWLLAVALVLTAGAIAFTQPVGLDWGNFSCHYRLPYCDDAKPVLDAVSRGHVEALWEDQSLLGPASIVLRAPFVAVARQFDDDTRFLYDVGLFACLLVLVLAGWLLARELSTRGRPRWLQWLVALGLVLNPVTFRMAHFGHPEEAVAAGLCVMGGLAVFRHRAGRAGAAVGAAIATKLWAVLVALPLVLALPRRLWKPAALAGVAAVLLLYGPVAAGDPERFWAATTSANELGSIPGTAQASNVWWPLMDTKEYQRPAIINADGSIEFETRLGLYLPSPWSDISHPLVVLLALAAALAWALTRDDERRRREVLLLLAALVLMRCILDPNNWSYYHLPFLACLIAWEGLNRGFPWLSLISAAGLQAIISISAHLHRDGAFAGVYLAWAVPTLAGLAFLLCRRSRSIPLTPP